MQDVQFSWGCGVRAGHESPLLPPPSSVSEVDTGFHLQLLLPGGWKISLIPQ